MLISVVLSTLLTGFPPPPTECRTIPSLVESARPKPVVKYQTRELISRPFEQVVAAAQLGVEGTVQTARTYLSVDECTLYTDYTVAVTGVLLGELPKPADKSDATVLVTTHGGHMTVDGVPVTVQDQQLPPFRPGEKVLLLLASTSRNARIVYEPVFAFYGAFATNGERIVHLLRNAGDASFGEMDRAAFMAQLTRRK